MYNYVNFKLAKICILSLHISTECIIISDPKFALDQYLPEADGIYWSKVYMGCGMKTPIHHLSKHTHTNTHWRHNNIRSHICPRPVSTWGRWHILVQGLHGMWYENTYTSLITYTHTHNQGIIISDPTFALDQYLRPKAYTGLRSTWDVVWKYLNITYINTHTHILKA